MNVYHYQTAAAEPRANTDTFLNPKDKHTQYQGVFDNSIRYIEKIQLLDPVMWRRFVQQFREDADFDAGWRGEYWGKMMRGACFTYEYTQNEELYGILTQTISDILDSQDEFGRISTYAQNHEFDGWDIWGRKYVMLGMQYFLEICKDPELAQRIIQSMCRQMDYIMQHIGPAKEGKKPITKATRHWRGLNSSSLLEPVVRLYSLTKEQKYLDYATYIVECGGSSVVNVFDLAYEDKLYPYQYPTTKAYEMTSCFEGLLEYYRIVGNERHRVSIINYANRILESDFTIIGCGGCTGELFDHSTVRQANTTNDKIAQETCVTVTLMKFFYQLHLLTGQSYFADAFELALYNAFFGSFNTELVKRSILDCAPMVMPFDSYSPLTAGTRGVEIGGQRKMSDGTFYGCCACIGSMGNGLIAKMATLHCEGGIVLNLFSSGVTRLKTPGGFDVALHMTTDYPKHGTIIVRVALQKDETFKILIRNPKWSKNTIAFVNQNPQKVTEGYIELNRTWKDQDEITIQFDMRTRAIYPTPYGSQVLMNVVVWGENYMIPSYDEEDPLAKNHVALQRGPLILAQENRLGYNVDEPVSIAVKDGYVEVEFPDKEIAPYDNMIELKVPCTDGTWFHVTDYASAGKLWNEESKMAAWILTK